MHGLPATAPGTGAVRFPQRFTAQAEAEEIDLGSLPDATMYRAVATACDMRVGSDRDCADRGLIAVNCAAGGSFASLWTGVRVGKLSHELLAMCKLTWTNC